MKRIDWKFLLVGAAMVLAAGAALALRPSPAPQPVDLDLERIIPHSFGDWSIDPLIVPIIPAPDVQANLARLYDQIVSRTYVNARGGRMMLTIAYGGDQSDALKAHRQEVCYAAQGFEIRNALHGQLRLREKTIPVTRILAVRGPRSEPVTYWFTMGDRVVLGRLERLMVQLRFGLSGRIPDGMLVRVSSISADSARAFEGHEEFVGELLGGMRRGDVPRLLGALEKKAGAPPAAAKLLFSSGFEGLTAVSGPRDCWGEGCWMDFLGLDSSTGFTWPFNLWGGTTRIQGIVGASVSPVNMGAYQVNEIQSVTGHDGNPTRALYTEIKQQYVEKWSQNDFIILPASEQGDIYISFWMKLQPDLAEKLKRGVGNWRVIWDWKSAGDYRITAQIVTWGGVAPYWQIRADTYANGGLPPQTFWEIQNKTVPVPIGRWFKFEAFVHRSSGADGRELEW